MKCLILSFVTLATFNVSAAPICALDMGSNSFKFMIAEMRAGKYVQLIDEVNDTVGVGDEVEATGRISEKKLDQIVANIVKYQQICHEFTKNNNAVVFGVATAAYRQAKNGAEFEQRMKNIGAHVEIIIGERESQMAYIAAVFGKPNQGVLDLGSRSSELVTLADDAKYDFKELDTGYKTAEARYFEPAPDFAAAKSAYEARLKDLILEGDFNIIANKEALHLLEGAEMAGFVLDLEPEKTEGVTVSKEQVAAKIREVLGKSETEFAVLKKKKGIEKILPRLVFVNYVFEHTNYAVAHITTRELYAAIVAELSNWK